MRITLSAAIFLLSANTAWAKCDQWGNCYSGNYGSGSYNGYNSNTGSMWSSRSTSRGQSGTDSSGNSWSYDRRSGNYYNYGTGKTCTGHGANRVCY